MKKTNRHWFFYKMVKANVECKGWTFKETLLLMTLNVTTVVNLGGMAKGLNLGEGQRFKFGSEHMEKLLR